MTEQEVYKKICPLIESGTEGIFWDFKRTLSDTADIIKDILAFSNSSYDGDSYIIVGISEPNDAIEGNKIALNKDDRRRLNTDANFIYLPANWDVHGLTATELEKMCQFSAKLTEQISCSMLISFPQCEFVPIEIKKTRWLYVIIVKKTPGVFISKKDIPHTGGEKKIAVKQGVLYVRIADTTIGARNDVASATEYIRIWKNYIDWLEKNDAIEQKEELHNEQDG